MEITGPLIYNSTQTNSSEIIDSSDALSNAQVILLYFTSSWCPECTSFSPMMKEFYVESKNAGIPFEVVQVSSDFTQEEYDNYMKSMGNWYFIPFNSSLIGDLKRYYQVCARKEMESVGVANRREGIPSILAMKRDGSVISYKGVNDILNDGIDVFDQWLQN